MGRCALAAEYQGQVPGAFTRRGVREAEREAKRAAQEEERAKRAAKEDAERQKRRKAKKAAALKVKERAVGDGGSHTLCRQDRATRARRGIVLRCVTVAQPYHVCPRAGTR